MNKYIVKDFSEFNLDSCTIKIIEAYIKSNKLFFLIYGNPLSGKTSLINLILDKYYTPEERKKNVLFSNIIKDQGINYFRNDLKNFCQVNNNLTNNKVKKTIVFDDMEILSDQCQIIITTLINNYPNINFILSCNDLNKINTSILHILETIKFKKITNDYLYKIYNNISKNINLHLNNEQIEIIINSSNYNISKLINYIKKIYIMNDNDKIKEEITNISINDYDIYIDLCKKKKYQEAIDYIINIYNDGFSVIDILDSLYLYIKNFNKLNEEIKFNIIKYLCNYINIFNNIHEDKIELIFLTNNIINLFDNY